ncbi:DUF3352 domain-containing protein [Prochlorococcus sp. MIT 1011]|uniref:DUF3352 domain-containing protein n=1 Tax=Prochlorococcus sp. MIT 1011 TaxID=3082520 RepID=UPI0039B3D2FA
MKSRLSFFLISAIIITSFSVGIFIWRNKKINEVSQLNQNSYSTPISAKYIPENAELVFHWKINPTILPSYVASFQGKINKNLTSKKVSLIRDSSLKLISLDFERDISKWVGEYGSFALFNTKNRSLDDWLIVLDINKNLNPEDVLETISIEKNINENIDYSNKLNISKSKIINSNQSIYFLNNKNHILVSSNPEILKLSINKIAMNKLSTKEKYEDLKLKDNLNDGILLFETSPNKIFDLIGQEKDIFELNKANKLISSMNVENKQLSIEGILSFDIKKENIGNGLDDYFIDKEKQLQSFNDYILIDNPKQYFGSSSKHPFQKLVTSVIQNAITNDYSNLFKIILQNTTGNLIWLNDKEWLTLTNKSDTNKKEINDILKQDKFISSNLDFQNKNLEIWSKFTTVENEKVELKESIEAIIQENKDIYLWSQNLSSISNFTKEDYLADNKKNNDREEEINDFNEIIRIHLGKEKTEVFLNNFYPYVLLKTMLGNKLDFPKNIDISVATPTINYPDFVKFKINL